MTALNFLLTRALARELEAGDEVLVTRLDHDANVAPWLALADDVGVVVRFVDVNDDLTLDLDDLAAKRSPRTRVVAFLAAANSVGTAPDIKRIVELAHEAGALAWVDAVHYGPHGPIDVAAWGCDVLICSPYKFFGPHMGMAFGREDVLRRWRPYKVRPSADEPVGRRFELGTQPACSPASSPPSTTSTRSAGTRSPRTSASSAPASSPASRASRRCTGCRRWRAACRPSASASGMRAQTVAEHLASRDVAVWWGNYYALETIRMLGLDEHDGAVRAGIVHYNTAEEVDRLLAGIAELG